MKLFQITVQDDMDEISYLKVSDKNEDEIKKEIEEKAPEYIDCLYGDRRHAKKIVEEYCKLIEE